MKKFLLLISAFSSMFLFTTIAQAKLLPQAGKAGSKVTAQVISGINVTPRLRSDRRAVIVYFSNLQNASKVSYSLIYDTSTQQEGAMGSLNLAGTSTMSQELLFGTCSKGVCTYHIGVKNAHLDVSYTTKSGKKYLKKFRLKV